MPYTLANPDRPRRHPPLTPSRSSSANSHDTSPSAPESQEMFTSTAGRSSMHSFLSSSDHTVVSEYPRRLSHEKSSQYLDDSSSIYKALPDIPLSAKTISNHKHRHSEDHDYYVAGHSCKPFYCLSTHLYEHSRTKQNRRYSQIRIRSQVVSN